MPLSTRSSSSLNDRHILLIGKVDQMELTVQTAAIQKLEGEKRAVTGALVCPKYLCAGIVGADIEKGVAQARIRGAQGVRRRRAGTPQG